MPAEHLHAVQLRWLGNRLYKLFVTKDALCAARVAGGSYNQELARRHTPPGLLGIILAPLYAHPELRRAQEEARYDDVDLSAPEFLTMHSHNFRLDKCDLQSVLLKPPPRWIARDNPDHRGFLEIRTFDAVYKFRLIEESSLPRAHALLEKLVGHVEVQET